MASSPPMISAPTLVTSTTNLVTATPSSNPGSSAAEDWRCKYLEAKENCRKLKTQMREQAKKSRQLILAVKTKLQDEESEKAKMKEWQDLELSNLCQQILALQASMLREQKRVELLLKEKDAIIGQQKAELGKLSTALPSTSSPTKPNNVSVTSLSAGAFGGSLRIHGSFRQYKKDREKIRHFKSSSGDSGINISSEESSSSPTTLPRTQKQQLPDNAAGSVKKKSMILKPVEFGVSPGQQKSSGLTNLQQLIEQKATTTKIQINKPTDPDTKSDSGRESDEPNISVVTVGSSAGTLDASSSSSLNGLKINVAASEQKKIKPPPPPRSSQTKLSTVVTAAANSQPKPKSILSPTSSLNTAASSSSMELSPTEALDKLIRNVDNNRSKKRVKFNPKIDIDSMKPLDPNFLHFLPHTTKSKQDFDKKQKQQQTSSMLAKSESNRNFSYYEPYL